MPEVELVYPEGMEPVYANRLLIRFNELGTEYVVDAFVSTQGQARSQVRARLVMTPQAVRSLLRALARSIARYEEQFGPIPEPGDDLARDLFGEARDGT